MAIMKRELKRPRPGSTGSNSRVAYLVRVEGKRDPVTGKRKQMSKQVETYKEAQKVERDWLQEIERGTAVDPKKMTVKELMEEWLESKRDGLTLNSWSDYEVVIRLHILPVLGNVLVQALTDKTLETQYTKWKQQGLSARMIRGCHMRISAALDRAVKQGIVYRNVAKEVKPPRLSRKKVETWTKEEAAAFLKQAQAMPVLNHGDTGRREINPLWPLWPLLLCEGLRRGEACGLRWRDVDLNRGTAAIVQSVAPDKSNRGKATVQEWTKTKSSRRTVRLTDYTIRALREHRDRQAFIRKAAGDTWQEHDLIVSTRFGTPINPANVTRSFDRITALTKLADGRPVTKITPHGLRHTCATLLMREGVHPKIVSERLGHASITITLDLYSHAVPDDQSAATQALDSLFAEVGT